MTLTLTITSDYASQLREQAHQAGLTLDEYAVRILEQAALSEQATKKGGAMDARALMRLPHAKRQRALMEAVGAALPAYEADQALPPSQRVLTPDLENGDFYEYGN